MQSRRREDYSNPSDLKVKLRDRRIELGYNQEEPFVMSRRDQLNTSPRSRRSLSPQILEGSRRLLGGDPRSNSLERREYVGGGGRGERVRSRSPPLGLVRKRPHFNEGASSKDLLKEDLRKRYEFVDYVDLNDDDDDVVVTGLKPEYRFQHTVARLVGDKDFDSTRLSGSSRHGMPTRKSMISKDVAGQGFSRLPADLIPASKYGEGGGNISSSTNLGVGRFKDENVRYPDPLLVDKLSYMEREKSMFYSTDVPYPRVPVSQSKDSIGTSQFKDFAGTPSEIMMANFQGSYQGGMPSPTEEYPRNSGKLTEHMGFSSYGQRSISDSGRDPNAKQKDLAYYQQDTYSPSKAERWNFVTPMPDRRGSDDYRYPSDESYRRISTRERADYEHTNLLRSGVMNRISERADDTEYTYRNIRESRLRDQPSMQKKTIPNYFGMGISNASKGGEYLDPGSAHIEFGRRMPIDQEMHLGASKDHEFSQLNVDYGFRRDAGPAHQNERMTNSPFKYEAEMHRVPRKTHEIEAEELGAYDSSDRELKRKYNMYEEMSRHNSRSIMGRKWYNTSRTQDLNDRTDELFVQDSSVSYSSRSLGYDNKLYQRAERMFVGESASRDRFSSRSRMEHLHDHSTRPYKPGGRYSKGHQRPGSLSSYNSYRFNRRHAYSKPQNVWIRDKDKDQVDMYEHEVDKSEDWVSYEESEPPEDSEEFKQLVQEAFLIFSKKLNDNPGVRKRYKEQGRAGTLYCIVCGRSLSKEFLDTRRLVTHAYMSHKIGLRAQHLGLHKAICVLLGWNSVASPDVITWVPEPLPDVEAMDQKEDLIIWPPVIIIHNSSIIEEQKTITIDSLGDFLRGKGFSGGKFKACFGKPPDRSIIVVKFLGTFPGLQDAERLHKYFVEKNRGRADFERVASSSSKGKSSGSDSGVVAKQEHEEEELVLYGYMGIAEDLDKVDLDTKRKCSIKSKKEIQELANAPVKPE